MNTTPFAPRDSVAPEAALSEPQASRTEFDPTAVQGSAKAGFILGDTAALWAATGAPRRDSENADEIRLFPEPVRLG